MNRDDAVTAVAEALVALDASDDPRMDAAGYLATDPGSVYLDYGRAAVAALEPYIAARIAAETETLREGRQADRVRAAEAVLNEQLRTARAEAELDEARAALAADRERLAAAIEEQQMSPLWDDEPGIRQAYLLAARIVRERP